jgi:multisubunit Na+/H+ antiporter MnhB subunit
MKLVPNAKQAWRWFSVQALTLIAALQVAWETLPPDAVNVIPADWRGYITLGLAVLAIVGRLIDQGGAKA